MSDKKMGRPRKTEKGGSNITFYMSREIQNIIRENGGSRWIAELVLAELKRRNERKQS